MLTSEVGPRPIVTPYRVADVTADALVGCVWVVCMCVCGGRGGFNPAGN